MRPRTVARVAAMFISTAAMVSPNAATGEVIYDELRSGDIEFPLFLVLRPGANVVRGSERHSATYNAAGEQVLVLSDSDSFRVLVPDGYKISSTRFSWSNGKGLSGVEHIGGHSSCFVRSSSTGRTVASYGDSNNMCANVVAQSSGARDLEIIDSPISAGRYLVAAGTFWQYHISDAINRDIGIYLDYRWTLNVLSTTGTNPRNYGLFVGVAADGANDDNADLRGDLAAARLAAAFGREPHSTAYTLTADTRRGAGISSKEFVEKLEFILSRTRTGDNVFIYLTGHGGGLLGVDDEDTDLGFKLTDDGLTKLLAKTPAGVNKWVFIDSCHGGGFWGPGDPVETSFPLDLDDGDLNRVSKTALLASSSEVGLAYYGPDGIPLISSALIQGWTRTSTGFLRADVDKNGVLSMADMAVYVREFATTFLNGYPGKIVYEMGLGTSTPITQDLLSPQLFATPDFGGELVTGTAFGVSDDVEPEIALEELASAVVGVGPGTSLGDKIVLAKQYFASSDMRSTCGALEAFVWETWAQLGKRLDTELGGELIESAQTIINAISCR